MAEEVRVRYEVGDRFTISVRDHVICVDQPVDLGGSDTAPTPTELFIASLASCVGFYARRFLARHDLSARGLEVITTYTVGSRPARVETIRVTLHVPEGVPDERRDALLAVAAHCTVHNTLVRRPDVRIALDTASSPAAAVG